DGPVLAFYPFDVLPEFPGRVLAMFKFITQNSKYPNTALKANAAGTVMVTLIVGHEGIIGEVEICKSVHRDIDAEAMRVIKAMPIWVPGRQNGEAVSVRYNIPLKFSVNK